jgi:ABC-type transport system substrate-binding protein
LTVVAAMVLSPYLFLPAGGAGRPLTTVVVGYDESHRLVHKPDPVVRVETYRTALRSIDPATCNDPASAAMQGYLVEGLYTYHFLKRPPTVVPLLAEGMPTVSPDRLTITIRIKPNVTYARNPCFGTDHLGRSATCCITADDFILAFKRCADAAVNANVAWSMLAGKIVGLDAFRDATRPDSNAATAPGDFSRYDQPVEGLRAIDEHTLQIRLTEPHPRLIYALAMTNLAPIPREAITYWLAGEDDGRGGRRPIPMRRRVSEFTRAAMLPTTGPYVLKTFQRKTKIVLVRNPDYRTERYPTEGAPGDDRSGLLDDAGKTVPFVDIVQFEYTPEPYSAWMRFLYKQVDSASVPRDAFEDIITPGKDLAETWREKGIRLVTYESPSIYWLAFNMDDPVLQASPSLRRALCLGFDVANWIDVLHNGRGRRAVNVIPSSFDGHAEAGGGPYYCFDRAAAAEHLAKARKELASAGLLEDGRIPTLRIDVGNLNERGRRQGAFIAQQFRQLGLAAEIRQNDWPTLQQRIDAGLCQIYVSGWRAHYPDAQSFLQLFAGENIETGTNTTHYRNAGYDRLYDRAVSMDPGPQRTELYAQLARMIGEDCPVLLLSEPISYVLVHDWAGNVKPNPVSFTDGKYRRIDTDLRRRMGGRQR